MRGDEFARCAVRGSVFRGARVRIREVACSGVQVHVDSGIALHDTDDIDW